jgi:hypothetical protein
VAPRKLPADESPRLGPAVATTLANLKLEPEDAAIAQLARVFAAAIDHLSPAEQATLLRHLAPGLIRVLEALGATPRARAAGSSRKDATPLPTSAPPPQVTALEQ